MSKGSSPRGRGTWRGTGGSAPPRQYTQIEALDALYTMGATAGHSRSSDRQDGSRGYRRAPSAGSSKLLQRVIFYHDPAVVCLSS
jgi:hypothetical protein